MRLRIVGALAVVALAAIGCSGMTEQSAGGASSTSEPPPEPDVIVFVRPDDAGAVDVVRTQLLADEAVVSLVWISQDTAFEAFQCLFADDPALLDSVTPDVLPPSFQVELADGVSVDAVSERWERIEAVRDVVPGAQGTSPFVGSTLPESDCPEIGERLK